MHIYFSIFLVVNSIDHRVLTVDVCTSGKCKCYSSTVNCDSKGWSNLDDIDFPSMVSTLTLINNNLKFDKVSNRAKIESFYYLINLSLNQNPLGIIPPFSQPTISSLSLQDTSLMSAKFPASYSNNSVLQTILLNGNKIHSIDADDFATLRNSKLKKLHIESSNVVKIDLNAFAPLIQLQSLSLKKNQLKSCEFLTSLPILSSINLDENQFTSLPPQLITPGKIKMFSFKRNSISVIDESSPLYHWSVTNATDIQIFLANNTLDCCLSLWFIRFLIAYPKFVGDASLLTCFTPADFRGKLLSKLNPNEMNCGGNIPNKTWWTLNHIIDIIVVGFMCLLIFIIVMTVVVCIYRRTYTARSGYIPISEDDEVYSNMDSSSFDRSIVPMQNDDYQTLNYTSNDDTNSIIQSDVLTKMTNEGINAVDRSIVGYSQLQEAALISALD